MAARKTANPSAAGEISYHFATPIYRVRLDKKTINPRIKKALDEFLPRYGTHSPIGWRCDVHSTYDNPPNIVELPEFQFLKDLVSPHIARYLTGLGVPLNGQLEIFESWFNFYAAHEYQEYHKHRGSVVSGIYYYEATIESPPTVFASPLKEDLDTQVAFGLSQYQLSDDILENEPRPGQLVLFPGWLNHCVMPNKGKTVRGTFSFNVTEKAKIR